MAKEEEVSRLRYAVGMGTACSIFCILTILGWRGVPAVRAIYVSALSGMLTGALAYAILPLSRRASASSTKGQCLFFELTMGILVGFGIAGAFATLARDLGKWPHALLRFALASFLGVLAGLVLPRMVKAINSGSR